MKNALILLYLLILLPVLVVRYVQYREKKKQLAQRAAHPLTKQERLKQFNYTFEQLETVELVA